MAQEYLPSGATTLASWLLASGAAGSGFAAGCQLLIPDGTQNIVTAVDQSAVAYGLSFEVARLFSGNIGTAASPLRYAWSDGSAAEKSSGNTEGYFKYFAGGGSCYLYCTNAAPTTTDNIFQNSPGAKLFLTNGTVSFMHIENGLLDVNTNCVITNFDGYGGSSTIDVQATPTNITNMTVWGGVHTLKRAVTGTLTINGGTVIYDYELAVAGTVAINGGTFDHRAGPITTLNHNAGIHDTTRMRRLSTVTTCTRKPNSVYRGTRVGGPLTITNDYNIGFITL